MKKAILYSAMALSTLGLSSCGDSFLVMDPVGSVSESTLMSPAGVDYVLTGAYSSFNNMLQSHWMGAASLSNYVFGDVAGADANKGSQSSDQSDFTQIEVYSFSAANSYIEGKWAAVYEATKRCNNVMSMINRMPEGSLPNADVIAAQAKFIKAVWMFEGIRMFGAYIPYVSVEDYDANTDPDVTNHSEGSSVADIAIWDKVEQDLKDAIAGLPETWPEGQYGRATSWMAKAVLAKLYLYWSSPYNGKNATADHWNDAKTLLDDIIANGKDAKGTKYKLADNYGDLFEAGKADWTGESVFDCQLAIDGTQTDTNTISYGPTIGQPGASGIGGWGFYQPTYEFVNSYMVDANGLPEAAYQSKDVLATVKTLKNDKGEDYQVPVSDLTTPVDPRLDHAAGRFGVPFLDYGVPTELNGWVRDYTNGGLYMNKKNLPKIADRPSLSVPTTAASSAKNFHVIRFAEILLMRAEVAIHENDLATALKNINLVRARAAKSAMLAADYESAYKNAKLDIPTYKFEDKVNNKVVENTVANYRIGLYPAFANAEAATVALQRELRAEFGMEGHRWFDIARWGTAGPVLNAFRDFENNYIGKYNAVYNENWVTFPIPETTIQTAEGRIVQGPNW